MSEIQIQDGHAVLSAGTLGSVRSPEFANSDRLELNLSRATSIGRSMR